jgi:PAS domain S-box-containing protein
MSEKNRKEGSLVRTKDEWERTFDAIPDLIALIDTGHRVIRVNTAMAGRLGVPPEKAVGLHCYEAVHGLSAPPGYCPHKKLLASGKEERAEVTEKRLRGTFDIRVTPMRDARGRLNGCVHVARDITKRKITEEALSRSEQKYRLLADNATDVIWVLDLGTRKFTFFSPSVKNLRGYTPAEAMELTLEQTLTPASLAKVMKDMREGHEEAERLGADEDRVRIIETEELCKDGSTIFAESKLKFLKDDDGRPTAVIGSSRDITKRKKAEAALEASEKRYRMLFDKIGRAHV